MKKKRLISILMSGCMLMGGIIPLAGVSAETKAIDGFMDDSAATEAAADIPAWGAVPNEAQLKYQKDGFAVFCHFGPNTFNGIEWGENYGTKTPNEIFTFAEDADFDAETIVKTAKEAGADRLMITAKHHDGFCIWDSETTNYDIAETDYFKYHQELDDGNGDILEEISDACTKYNLDMGLYLSPWDIHEQNYGCFGDQNNNPSDNGKYTDYNELYQAQIREICTAKKEDGTYKYGNNNPDRSGDRFVEWWMDGATGSGAYYQTYDWEGIFAAIRETNPDCQIFGTHNAGTELGSTGGIHWIGNEAGIASVETWAKVNEGESYEDKDLYPRDENGCIIGKADGDKWSVPEADTKLLSAGWFWSASKESSLLSMEKLGNMYFNTIGRGAVLLLNVSPNTSGTLDENQKNRLIEFGQAIKDIYANDLTEAEGVTVYADSIYQNSESYKPSNLIDEYTLNTSVTKENRVYDETCWAPADGAKEGTVIIDLGSEQTFDTVKIEEYIQKGQRISEFSIEYLNNRGQWKEFYSGKTIGSQSVTRHSPVTSSQIKVTVKSDYATPVLNDIGIYKGPEAFELSEENNIDLIVDESQLDYVSISNASRTGSWQTSDYTHYWSAGTNSTVTFNFTGTAFYVRAIEDPNHSSFEVVVDGESMGTVNLNSTTRTENKIVYYSDEISYGEHTVEIKTLSSSGKACIDIYGIYGLNIEEGIFEVGSLEYDVAETDTITLEVVRKHGSTGEATVNFSTTTGSAQQNMNYEYKDGTLTFSDGETSKKIDVKAFAHRDTTGILNFFLDINTPTGALLGENTRATVYIHPADRNATQESLNELVAEAENLSKNSLISEEAKAYLEAKIGFAKDATGQADAEQSVYGGAYTALTMAVSYAYDSISNIFTLPSAAGESAEIEAENGQLVPTVADDKHLHTKESSSASGGVMLDWYMAGDKVIIPFYAEKAGTYNMTIYAECGRVEGKNEPNKLLINGMNIEEQTAQFYGDANPVIKPYEMQIVVTKSGYGEIVFTALEGFDGPNMDKLVFVLAEVASADKTKLEAKINEAKAIEDIYTVNSYQNLVEAYEAGEIVLNDDSAVQTDIDNAAAKIEEAIAALAYNQGDVNHDGAITILDATDIQKYLVRIEMDNFDVDLADTNNNNSVSIMDVTILQMVLAGRYNVDDDGKIVR